MKELQEKIEYAKEQLDLGKFDLVKPIAEELRLSGVEQFVQYGILLDALVLSEQDRDDEAMVFYDELIQKHPKLEYAYYYRFEALIRELEFEKARQDAEQLVSLDSQNIEYFNCLITADEFLGDYHHILAHCDKVLAIYPEESDFVFTKAMANTKLGNLKEALADYVSFIEMDTVDMEDLAMAYLDMGLIYLQLNDFGPAKSFLEKARVADDFDPQIESSLGLIHAKTTNKEKGLKRINEVIEFDPESSYPYINRARLLLEMGNPKQAKSDLNTAERHDIDFLYGTDIEALRVLI